MCNLCNTTRNSDLTTIIPCNHKYCHDCIKIIEKDITMVSKCNSCTNHFHGCFFCGKKGNNKNSCKNHPICSKCIKRNRYDGLILECRTCRENYDNRCRSCLKEYNGKEKIPNPNHKSHHFCEACFKSKKTIKENVESCKECRKFYKSDGKNKCKICKSSIKKNYFQMQTCKNHCFCSACFTMIQKYSNYIKKIWLNCIECEQIFQNPETTTKIGNKSRTSSSYSPVRKPSSKESEQFVSCIVCHCNGSNADIKFNTCQRHIMCKECYKSSKLCDIELLPCDDCNKFIKNNLQGKKYEDKSVKNSTITLEVISKDQYFDSLPVFKKNQSEKSTFDIYSDFKPKKIQKICREHNGLCDIMECNHLFCKFCISESFEKQFRLFIYKMHYKNIQELNSTEFFLGCYVHGCYNKLCYSFQEVRGKALEILNESQVHPNFADYHAIYFEGIPMRFKISQNCNSPTGYFLENQCWYCEILKIGQY